jgi:hypothetical protein
LTVARSLDGAVLNAPGSMAVNFPVADRGSFVVFASDSQSKAFLSGRRLTLTANFSDGSTATAVTTGAIGPRDRGTGVRTGQSHWANTLGVNVTSEPEVPEALPLSNRYP